jgi:hypothetical protein
MNTGADFLNNLEFHRLLAPRTPRRGVRPSLGEQSVLTAYLPRLAGALENVKFGGAGSKCLRGDDSEAEGGIHFTVGWCGPAVEGRTCSVEPATSGNFCGTLGLWRGLRKTESQTVEDVGRCASAYSSRSTAEIVKTEGKEPPYQGRFRCARETDDVGRWQEENCRSAKAEMGESQSEGRVERRPFPLPVRGRLFDPRRAAFL